MCTVEPLNKDTCGTGHFVLCREIVPLSEEIFYRVCIREYFWLVLYWEVCPLSDLMSFIRSLNHCMCIRCLVAGTTISVSGTCQI